MTIKILYFAILQDQRGLSDETLEVEAQTVRQLYEWLKQKYTFSLDADALRVSVNQTFASWDTKLCDGDEVVFIPPVSGG
jgi:molybdopterin converting factor subunit 1